MLAHRCRTVPFVDLARDHAPLRDELRAAFDAALDASAFTLGPPVERFERDFAAACGVTACVGVSSGTAALEIALRAVGIGPGDEVVVPAHTFAATALAVVHAGATPVLCDVEDATGLIDPDSAAAVVTSATVAIIGVHLYGQVCRMDALRELADRHALLLVEDAAQAHGARLGGAPAGSLGDVACFSFYPSKNLGALGDGGAICTSSPSLADRARALRDLGQRVKGEHVLAGANDRLDAVQAAFLSVKLPHLSAANAARRQHAMRYRATLPEDLRAVGERPESPSVHHVFAVRVADRDRVAERLLELGVQTGVHYRRTLDEHPPLACRVPIDVPVARAWAAETLSLPMFPGLRDDEIDQVVTACRARR